MTTHKSLVVTALETYKGYWTRHGVVDWDFDINELQFSNSFLVEIRCGRRNNVRLYKREFALDADVDKIWSYILYDIILAGVEITYKNTVLELRKQKEVVHSFAVDMAKMTTQYPYTPNEAFIKK